MSQIAPGSNQTSMRPEFGLGMEEYDLEAEMEGYVGLDIMPVLEVGKPSGHFPYKEVKDQKQGASAGSTLGPSNNAGGIDDRRNQDGTFNTISSGFTTKPFRTHEHGVQERVDKRNAEAYSDYFDQEMDAAMNTRSTVLENQNRRIIDLVTDDNRIANQAAAGVWSSAAADVIGDIRAAIITLRGRVGRLGLASSARASELLLTIDYDAFLNLKSNNGVLSAYVGSNDRSQDAMDLDALAKALNVGKVRVSGTMQNDAGQPVEASLSSMWPRSLALVSVASTNRRRARLGNTFHYGWGGSEIGGVFQSWFDPNTDSDWIRHRMDVAEQLIYPQAAQLITGVL